MPCNPRCAIGAISGCDQDAGCEPLANGSIAPFGRLRRVVFPLAWLARCLTRHGWDIAHCLVLCEYKPCPAWSWRRIAGQVSASGCCENSDHAPSPRGTAACSQRFFACVAYGPFRYPDVAGKAAGGRFFLRCIGRETFALGRSCGSPHCSSRHNGRALFKRPPGTKDWTVCCRL